MEVEIPFNKIGEPGGYPLDQDCEVTSQIGEMNSSAPRLMIRFNMQWNEVVRCRSKIEFLENSVREDVGVLQQVRVFIKQLRNPFGFLSYEIDMA